MPRDIFKSMCVTVIIFSAPINKTQLQAQTKQLYINLILKDSENLDKWETKVLK